MQYPCSGTSSKCYINITILLIFTAGLCFAGKLEPDTLKISEILNRAKLIEKDSFAESVRLCENAIYISDSIHLPEWKLKASNQKLFLLLQHYPDSVIVGYIPELTKCLKEQNDQKAEANIYNTLGSFFISRGNSDSAYKYINTSKNIYEELNDSLGLAEVYLLTGVLYQRESKTAEPLELYIKAAGIFEKEGAKEKLVSVYNTMGAINLSQKFYNEAIEYFSKALKVAADINNTGQLITINQNLAAAYKNIDSLDRSEEIYLETLKIVEENNFSIYTSGIYLSLGGIAKLKGNYDKALEYYSTSVSSYDKSSNEFCLMMGLINIGRIKYKYEHNLSGAEDYLLRGYKIAEKLNYREEIRTIYYDLYEINKQKKMTDKALRYLEMYQAIDDSLRKKAKDERFLEISKKYETEKQENEILQLENEGEKQKIFITTLIVLALFLSTIVLLLLLRRRHVLAKKEAAELKSKNLKLTLESRNKELAQSALNIAHLKENSSKIASEINKLMHDSDKDLNESLRKLAKKLVRDSVNPQAWSEFDQKFNEANAEFYSKIITLYPELSPTELRLVSFLRLQLSTKDIAEILQRSIRTVENTRRSIRKKMQLEQSENLTTFILKL